MADRARHTVIRRKVKAGSAAAPNGHLLLPAKALSVALVKAADALLGLALAAKGSAERIASLPDLLERLPENGLLAVLEGPEDAQGLMAFDSGLLSVVIEKQMTGVVSVAPPGARRVTRTDAALAADLIDATLQRFETALEGREESRWAGGFGYASHVEDLRPLGLLLEEIDYRIFTLDVDVESGVRSGTAVLALPAEGRGKVDLSSVARSQDAEDPIWHESLRTCVLQGEVRLDAILHRFRLPISAVGQLRIGDEVSIPVSAIYNVRLAGTEQIPLGRCRLGQSQGSRAVRLGADGAGAPEPSPDREETQQTEALVSPTVTEAMHVGAEAGELPALPKVGLAGDGEVPGQAQPMALAPMSGLPEIG